MKKILILLATLTFFVACSKETGNQELVLDDNIIPAELCYVGPHDLTISIKTKDNFKTVEMQDNSERIFTLVNNGLDKFTNENGVTFVKLPKKVAYAELVPGKKIALKEIKCL